MAPEDVVGVSEIAEFYGVPKRTAARYVDRDDFPEPLARLASGRVWARAAAEAWKRDHLPLPPGRPRKEEDQ